MWSAVNGERMLAVTRSERERWDPCETRTGQPIWAFVCVRPAAPDLVRSGLTVVVALVFGGRDVMDRLEESAVVEPVVSLQRA
jgi:hypothetical protein